MTIPFSFPQLGNTNVVSMPPVQHPDFGDAFLQAFLQAKQEAGQNSRTSAQVDIRKQELALEAAKEKTKQEELRTQGMGIQALIQKLSGTQDAEAQAHERAMTPMPITGQPLIQPSTGQPLPAIQSTPSAAPVIGTPGGQPQDAFAAMADVTKNMDPASVIGFLKEVHPMFQDAIKRQASAKSDAAQEKIIATLPANMQDATRRIVLLAKAGANLPAAAQRAIAPELFPADGSTDPAQVNAFTTAFRTGSFSAGQAAKLAGMNLPAGIDPGIKYVPPINPLAKALTQGATQLKMANLALEMHAGTATVSSFLDQHPDGVSFFGQVLKNKLGGTGLIDAIESGGLKLFLSDDEITAITAMKNRSVAWGHAISGARLPTEQILLVMKNSTPEYNDPPATKEYKRRLMALQDQGIDDIARGVRTPTQVINAMLTMAWTPEIKKQLVQQKGEAVKFEKAMHAGTAPFPVSGDAPTDSTGMQAQLDQLRAIIAAQPATEP